MDRPLAGSRGRGRKPRIDLRHITEAAVELLDEVGLAGLTTRRLASKLGVKSSTLYWHVRNKDELLDLVAEAICADAFVIDSSLPWRDQLASGLRQFRQLLLAHRDAADLLRERPPTGPHRLGHIETTMRILAEAGFPDGEAAVIAQLLTAHVLTAAPRRRVGHRPDSEPDPDTVSSPAGQRLGRLDDYPHLRRVLPFMLSMSDQDRFTLGAEIILDGLSHRARARAPGSPGLVGNAGSC